MMKKTVFSSFATNGEIDDVRHTFIAIPKLEVCEVEDLYIDMTEHESTIDLNPAADEIIDDSMAVDDGMFSMLAQITKGSTSVHSHDRKDAPGA